MITIFFASVTFFLWLWAILKPENIYFALLSTVITILSAVLQQAYNQKHEKEKQEKLHQSDKPDQSPKTPKRKPFFSNTGLKDFLKK